MSEDKTMVQQCFSEIGKRFSKMERSLKRLPYDAEVEYVTFPVGSAVDTGIIAYPRVFEWEATIRVPSSLSSTGDFRIGEWDGAVNKSVMVWVDTYNSRKLDIIEGKDYRISDWSAIQDKFGKIGYDGSKVFCGENYTEVESSYTIGNTNKHFTFFGLNGIPYGGSDVSCDFAGATFTFNGIKIRDFIPVRLNEIGYLYDKVTQDFYGSVSEIPLIPGPDK